MTPEELKKYREREALEIEASKQKMADEMGLERNRRFDIAWGIAWILGHSAGLSEVENYLRDFEELIRS